MKICLKGTGSNGSHQESYLDAVRIKRLEPWDDEVSLDVLTTTARKVDVDSNIIRERETMSRIVWLAGLKGAFVRYCMP